MEPETPSSSERDRSRELVAVAFCIVLPTIVTLAYFIWFADKAEALKLAFGIGKVVQFGFPVVFAWLYARKRIGLPRKSKDGVGFGLVFGVIIATATALLYAWWLKPAGEIEKAAEQIQNKVAGFGIDSALAYFGLGVFYAVAHSFLEEYYWRWFVFGQLRPWASKTSAIVISSLGFMAHHIIADRAARGPGSLRSSRAPASRADDSQTAETACPLRPEPAGIARSQRLDLHPGGSQTFVASRRRRARHGRGHPDSRRTAALASINPFRIFQLPF